MTPGTVKVFFALANTKRNASVLGYDSVVNYAGLRIKVLSRLQVADIKKMIIKLMEPSLNLTNLHVCMGWQRQINPHYPVEWKAGEDGREKSSRTKNYGKEEGGRRKEEGGRRTLFKTLSRTLSRDIIARFKIVNCIFSRSFFLLLATWYLFR